MTEEEYFELRLNDQITWYDKKSSYNKKMFMRLKTTEIILALFIPLMAGLGEFLPKEGIFFTGLLGLAVAAIASALTLYKFHENWIEYRGASEALKYEKFLYITGSGFYKDNRIFPLFVERIEGILSKENSRWSAGNSSQKSNEKKQEVK